MPDGFRCPNPACNHVFAPAAVKGAAALVCPRCRTRFQFRRGQSMPTVSSTPPPAPIPPPVPRAPVPVQPQPLPHMDITEPSPFNSGGRRRRHQRGHGWHAVVVLFVIAAGVAGGVFLVKHLNLQPPFADLGDGDGPVHESTAFNYRLALPADWRLDEAAKRSLRANLVLRQSEPPSQFALFTKDYKDRTPRDSELIDEADRRLRAYFQGVEWEKKDDVTLAGERAQRLVFQGNTDNVAVVGECSMTSRRGYAYWLVNWRPHAEPAVAEKISAEWSELRNGFFFLDSREGWTERIPKQVPLRGVKAAYSLSFTEGLWERRPAADYDPNAEIALLGRDKVETKDADKAATVLVLVLPPESDLQAAVKSARKDFEEKLKREQRNVVIEAAKDKDGKAEDRPEKIGKTFGHLTKLHLKVPATDWEHLAFLAVVSLPDGVVLIHCDCAWERRNLWEIDFSQILKTFEAR